MPTNTVFDLVRERISNRGRLGIATILSVSSHVEVMRSDGFYCSCGLPGGRCHGGVLFFRPGGTSTRRLNSPFDSNKDIGNTGLIGRGPTMVRRKCEG